MTAPMGMNQPRGPRHGAFRGPWPRMPQQGYAGLSLQGMGMQGMKRPYPQGGRAHPQCLKVPSPNYPARGCQGSSCRTQYPPPSGAMGQYYKQTVGNYLTPTVPTATPPMTPGSNIPHTCGKPGCEAPFLLTSNQMSYIPTPRWDLELQFQVLSSTEDRQMNTNWRSVQVGVNATPLCHRAG
ncbi:zinc finger MIZ domain-containing protein 1-like protein [Lates japonicus]|uniref:Zinc finger MIZ domain-containing protein 1-like protein n=1 Tax=Lates japonicus TaxID=270547 RepID=A0AAD3RBH0_LATJO|nr:zinc finger MIZ domain-containing protein 1-like protein [Lates japonicus]